MDVLTVCLSWARQLFNECCSFSVVKRVFIFRISGLQHLQRLGNLKLLLQNIQLLFLLFPKASLSFLYQSDPILDMLSSTNPVNEK